MYTHPPRHTDMLQSTPSCVHTDNHAHTTAVHTHMCYNHAHTHTTGGHTPTQVNIAQTCTHTSTVHTPMYTHRHTHVHVHTTLPQLIETQEEERGKEGGLPLTSREDWADFSSLWGEEGRRGSYRFIATQGPCSCIPVVPGICIPGPP